MLRFRLDWTDLIADKDVGKEWARNNFPVLHPIFGLSLFVLQSKNTHFSSARAAFFLNQNEQIQTKCERQTGKLSRGEKPVSLNLFQRKIGGWRGFVRLNPCYMTEISLNLPIN